ncbi:hypothetical protein RXV86_09395 [Alisedimentitalea sp. MJ-SS2]|uniref:hypothetical protein n=1 Tax=Aliisedimentitalea sp. MJ-SS2 TaxID=3049795 RepID=UPI00290B23FA|nr:hypothetical protein [Alisedimentitalea sp. MJ-SS2]MDU8927597.1 hypothetical protein [Alisedimentitalea sp. MJ-SS2]
MSLEFWIIQVPGWALFFYLLVAQCSAALSYRLGVRMGTQEPAETVGEIGVAFWKGYAFADLVFYTPVLGVALYGHASGADWALFALAAVLGITVYWPIACLRTIVAARDAAGWQLPKERDYWIVLPAITAWGVLALSLLWP